MRRRPELARSVAATLAVTLAGIALLSQLTGGLRWFTSESWRRADIEAAPRALPDVALEDQQGRAFRLRELCGEPMLVDFVYTRCPTVCRSLGAASAQLAQRLDRPQIGKASVLSVSFDPAHDTPAQLRAFKRSLDPVGSRWAVVRPVAGLDVLLRTFGVVVIADGYGGFEHNAALHAVDRSCRLTRVFDIDEVADAEQWLRTQR